MKDRHITAEMRNRERIMKAPWRPEGAGYFSLVACSLRGVMVAYLSIPSDHPYATGTPHANDPDVTGGITFRRANVVGWDYEYEPERFATHAHLDIRTAIKFYKQLHWK